MTYEKYFYYWGERGLVTTFFMDLIQSKNPNCILGFISLIEFKNPVIIKPEEIKRFDIIVEPDFANTGFGHPDTIFSISFSNNKKYVFILEAKRGTYLKACKDKSARGSEGYNSSLNGQLELNYCLTKALEKFRAGDNILIEPEWILETPYKNERKGNLRCLKRSSIIKNVVSKFASEPIENYFHIILTNDNENPLDNTEKRYLPELFVKTTVNGKLDIYNCWNLLKKKQFGWLNFKKLVQYIKQNEKDFVFNSFFIRTYDLNKTGLNNRSENINLSVNHQNNSTTLFPNDRGVCLIYVPIIAANTFLHFSWGNSKGDKNACAIRNFMSGNINPNRDYSTSELEKLVTKRYFLNRKLAIDNVNEWKKVVAEYNNKYLGK